MSTHALLVREEARCAAWVGGDAQGIESFLASTVCYVHATGAVHDRAELLDFIRTQMRYSSMERAQLAVQTDGRTAVMTGLMRLAGQRVASGDRVASISYVTQIWTRTGDAWLLGHFQGTRVEDARWPGA